MVSTLMPITFSPFFGNLTRLCQSTLATKVSHTAGLNLFNAARLLIRFNEVQELPDLTFRPGKNNGQALNGPGNVF